MVALRNTKFNNSYHLARQDVGFAGLGSFSDRTLSIFHFRFSSSFNTVEFIFNYYPRWSVHTNTRKPTHTLTHTQAADNILLQGPINGFPFPKQEAFNYFQSFPCFVCADHKLRSVMLLICLSATLPSLSFSTCTLLLLLSSEIRRMFAYESSDFSSTCMHFCLRLVGRHALS